MSAHYANPKFALILTALQRGVRGGQKTETVSGRIPTEHRAKAR